MLYVSVAPTHAHELSRSLMRLLRPAHLRQESWTDLYCGVLTHPETGQTVLALPETETVPVHMEATGEELADLLRIFVVDPAITQAEADGIVSAVQGNAGTEVRIADFIPPSWAPYVLSHEQILADGWLPPVEPPEETEN